MRSSSKPHKKSSEVFADAVKFLEKQKAYEQIMDQAEQTLARMKRLGNSHDAILRHVIDASDKINQYANELMWDSKVAVGIRLLLRVEKMLLLHECPELAKSLNLTYNNLACVYKHAENLRLALRYLETAEKVAAKYKDNSSLTMTHLNKSAILSELGDHQQALESANRAAAQCQVDLIRLGGQISAAVGAAKTKLVKERGELNSLLAIAFYNIGIQTEFQAGKAAALKFYTKAISTVADASGVDPKLREAFISARDKALECACANARPSSSLAQRLAPEKATVVSSAVASPKMSSSYKSERRIKVLDSVKIARPQTATRPMSPTLSSKPPVFPRPETVAKLKFPVMSPKSNPARHARSMSIEEHCTNPRESQDNPSHPSKIAWEIEQLKQELKDELQSEPIPDTGSAYHKLTKVKFEPLGWKKHRSPPGVELDPETCREVSALRRLGFLEWDDEEQERDSKSQNEARDAGNVSSNFGQVTESPSMALHGNIASERVSISLSKLSRSKEQDVVCTSDPDRGCKTSEMESFAAVEAQENPFDEKVTEIRKNEKKEGNSRIGLTNGDESLFADNKTARQLVGYGKGTEPGTPVTPVVALPIADISTINDLGHRKVLALKPQTGNILSLMAQQQQAAAPAKRGVPKLDEAVILTDISGISVLQSARGSSTPAVAAARSQAPIQEQRPEQEQEKEQEQKKQMPSSKAAETIQKRYRGYAARKTYKPRKGRNNWKLVHRGLYRQKDSTPRVLSIHFNEVEGGLVKISLYDMHTHRTTFSVAHEFPSSSGPEIRKSWEETALQSAGRIEEDCEKFFASAKQEPNSVFSFDKASSLEFVEGKEEDAQVLGPEHSPETKEEQPTPKDRGAEEEPVLKPLVAVVEADLDEGVIEIEPLAERGKGSTACASKEQIDPKEEDESVLLKPLSGVQEPALGTEEDLNGLMDVEYQSKIDLRLHKLVASRKASVAGKDEEDSIQPLCADMAGREREEEDAAELSQESELYPLSPQL